MCMSTTPQDSQGYLSHRAHVRILSNPSVTKMRPLTVCIKLPPLLILHEPPHLPLLKEPQKDFLTHLSERRVLIHTHSHIGLGQRAAPQHRDVQGKEKKSQQQQKFRRQTHHPLDAAALRSLRCGRGADSASSGCRDSNLRIRRGRGAATPLGSHFGGQNCKSAGKTVRVGRSRTILEKFSRLKYIRYYLNCRIVLDVRCLLKVVRCWMR